MVKRKSTERPDPAERHSELSLQYPPEPQYAGAHAELAISMARSVSRVRLDYSVRSLRKLDGIIARFDQEQVTADEIPETLFTFGCYLGEVLIRQCGGEWHETSEGPPGLRMRVRLVSGETTDPIGQVFRRLAHGQSHSLAAYYREIAAGCPRRPGDDRSTQGQWWQIWKR